MKWTEEHGKELLEDKLLTAQVIKENYISKDKIRENIDKADEMITNEFVCETYKDRYEFLRKKLKELLEEN